MRVHLLSLPNGQTTKEYSLDGFLMATIRFAKVLKLLGYHVTLYGSEENEAPCDEFVCCVTKEEIDTMLGDMKYQFAGMSNRGMPLWWLANNRMIKEIAKRKGPHDFICMIGGNSQKPVADAHPDLMSVEYSIGYASNWAKYRVFESRYCQAMSYGKQNISDGRFFDDVIPLFLDPSEFKFRGNAEKEPFALYVGRLTVRKGLAIACRAAALAGIKLKVIGHGDTSLITHGAEYLGAVSMEERNEWFSRASVLIAPTIYLEPFGGIATEAQMCGTPVVATDFGGFTETIEHGKTGYRCNYLGEFAQALLKTKDLDCGYIRKRALDTYSIAAVAPSYDRYFKRLMLLWGDGWETGT